MCFVVIVKLKKCISKGLWGFGLNVREFYLILYSISLKTLSLSPYDKNLKILINIHFKKVKAKVCCLFLYSVELTTSSPQPVKNSNNL